MAVLVILGSFLAARLSYLFFHTLAEGFAVLVAVLIYVVASRTHRYSRDDFLLFLGNAYLFIALVDVLHTMTYQGMGIFPGYGPNTPTQLWIAGRYVDALSLLAAPVFFTRRLPLAPVSALYAAVVVVLVGSIMVVPVFPTAFIPGEGLTPFKVASEYVVCVLLLAAILHLRSHRDRLDRPVYQALMAAMAVTILAELSFTLYSDVYGLMNLVGHLFKILAYYLVYLGVVMRGLEKPYQEVSRLNQELERRVWQRTSELQAANARLKGEIEEHLRSEAERERLLEEVRRQAAELDATINSITDGVTVYTASGAIVRMNPAARRMMGYSAEEAALPWMTAWGCCAWRRPMEGHCPPTSFPPTVRFGASRSRGR